MPSLPRLTEMAHSMVSLWLRPGDLAIDATLGNGHDTELMAGLVGGEGRVLALDIEPEAIAVTRSRFERDGLPGRQVEFKLCDHGLIGQHVPVDWVGRVRVIMSNLGYRPHSDMPVRTRLVSTLSALAQSMEILAEGGLISVVAYRAHEGGESETQAILECATSLDDRLWHVARYDLPNIRSRPPVFIAITKRRWKKPSTWKGDRP